MSGSISLAVTELGAPLPKLLTACIALSFTKEAYTPYSIMKASFIASDDISGEIIDAELLVNGVTVHKGITDYSEIRESPVGRTLILTSRGYTSMLGQNELVPGLMTGVSLNSLMTDYLTLPNIYHENLTAAVNYIFVKEHSSLWDAAVALCLKQKGYYPYIANVNKIMFSLPQNPKEVYLSKSAGNILGYGTTTDYSRAVSDFHMRDTEGTYNTFNYSDSSLHLRGIVRHKHINLDRQWLNAPQTGLMHKVNFSARGMKTMYVRYAGYGGEDLNDLMIWEDGSPKRISRIDIRGTAKGITTKLWCYEDRYFT